MIMEYFSFLIVVKNAAIGFFTTKSLGQIFKSNKTPAPNTLLATVPQDQVSIPKDIYRENLENAVKRKELEMQVAQGEEKVLLLQEQIAELNKRLTLTDPQKSLEEKNARIASLESALEREGNDIGAEKLEKAKIALENSDFSKADKLFAEIETHEELALQRSARVAFARGQIAEQEIRWKDAAKHYARTAHLAPNFDTLIKAEELAYAVGDDPTALFFNTKLKKEAIAEYGKESKQYAQAISNLGLIYTRQKKYKKAEQRHKEALKLRQDILEENDPDIAESLNNFATLYLLQKKYNEAEPLLKQALNIYKKTLGDNHPNTAHSLNSLGLIYYKRGEYKEAEQHCKKALEIFEATLGPNHPTTKFLKGSYKNLKKGMPDD